MAFLLPVLGALACIGPNCGAASNSLINLQLPPAPAPAPAPVIPTIGSVPAPPASDGLTDLLSGLGNGLQFLFPSAKEPGTIDPPPPVPVVPVSPPLPPGAIPSHYSTLIGFGDSYSDNSHARAAEYSVSYCKGPEYQTPSGGRCSNGPIAVDYMVETSMKTALSPTAIQSINYAFSGALISNTFGLNPYAPPGLDQQIQMFAANLTAGDLNVKVENTRTLVSVLIGINTVAIIYLNDIVKSSGGANAANKIKALNSIHDNLDYLSNHLEILKTESLAHIKFVDYLFINTPNQVQIPFVKSLSSDPASLAFAKELSDVYNAGLANITMSFKLNMAGTSRVFGADLAGMWNQFYTNPTAYGISPGHAAVGCYNKGILCKDPETYLTIDNVHLTTTVQLKLAEYYNSIVMAAEGYAK